LVTDLGLDDVVRYRRVDQEMVRQLVPSIGTLAAFEQTFLETAAR
jgi:hypothetical protein